jgi:hypothetical protein
MNLTLKLSKVLASVVAVGTFAAIAFVAVPASAQDDDIPPPEVIATLTPVYHEGHAAYWYHNHWHYRDGSGAWAYYHDEPAYLHTWRGSHQFDRRYYGHRR